MSASMSLHSFRYLIVLTALMGLLGCSTEQVVEQAPMKIQFDISVDKQGSYQADLEKLVIETKAVLQEDLFRNDLLKWFGVDRQIALGLRSDGSIDHRKLHEILEIFSGKSKGYSVSPSVVRHGEKTPISLSNVDERNQSNVFSIEIGQAMITRYRSKKTVSKSCAINELARKMSMTIQTDDGKQIFSGLRNSDILKRDKNAIIAHYLIGSAAQCTWLVNKAIIDTSSEAYGECVTAFGVRGFNEAMCVKFADDVDAEV